MGFNQLKNKYLNYLFIICRLNIIKLVTSTHRMYYFFLFLFPLLNIWHDQETMVPVGSYFKSTHSMYYFFFLFLKIFSMIRRLWSSLKATLKYPQHVLLFLFSFFKYLAGLKDLVLVGSYFKSTHKLYCIFFFFYLF